MKPTAPRITRLTTSAAASWAPLRKMLRPSSTACCERVGGGGGAGAGIARVLLAFLVRGRFLFPLCVSLGMTTTYAIRLAKNMSSQGDRDQNLLVRATRRDAESAPAVDFAR